jgi:hypothetical protein
MTTERADFRFTVKEGDEGKPWIAFEPSGRQLTSIKGCSVARGSQRSRVVGAGLMK